MGGIVSLIGIIIRQVFMPSVRVGLCALYELGCTFSENGLEPKDILVPRDVGNLVFVHKERCNGDGTNGSVVRRCQEVVGVSKRERATLDRHHAYRSSVAHNGFPLKVSVILIKIVPTCCIGYLGIQFTITTASRKDTYESNQPQEMNVYAQRQKIKIRNSGHKGTTFFLHVQEKR